MDKNERPHVIISSSMSDIGHHGQTGYIAHAYCHGGSCSFTFNEKRYTMMEGDCLIVRQGYLITDVEEAPDFNVDIILVTPEFIEISTPRSNYGMKGTLALFNNPIMRLTPEQREVCVLDFEYIKQRLALTSHRFHRDAMINAIECMIIDFFDFHATLYGNDDISTMSRQLMKRFQGMLERGDFIKHRTVNHYASELCVTAKYLSEVCKEVSGSPASYWINRYTTLDISRRMKEKSMTIAELADFYGFSSPSYFSRYVQKYLGAQPSDLMA